METNQHTDKDIPQMGERLGGGSFGEVFKGTWEGRQVAVKTFYNDHLSEYDSFNSGLDFQPNRRDLDILSKLDHPNLVKYYTVIENERVPPIIVLELCDYDLSYFITEICQRKVSFKDTVSIMSDVARGLDYLHNFEPEPIIHRDLGSKNILLKVTKNHKQAKITDISLAKVFPQRAMYAPATVDTPIYAAPETCPARQPAVKKAYYTEKIDIFSFGAVLLEVIIGRRPINPLPEPLLEGRSSITFLGGSCLKFAFARYAQHYQAIGSELIGANEVRNALRRHYSSVFA